MKMTRGAVKAGCGAGAALLAVLLITLDPVALYTHLYTGVRVGSELYRIWEAPPAAARVRVYLFNITNAAQFLAGEHATLHLEEVGPFTYLETRSNINMSVARGRGVLRFRPRTRVRILPELSVDMCCVCRETRSNINMSVARGRGVLRFRPRTRVRILPELSVDMCCVCRETRSNINMSVARGRGVLRFRPRTRVRILPELSVDMCCVCRETRSNINMSVARGRGVLRFRPRTRVRILPELSVDMCCVCRETRSNINMSVARGRGVLRFRPRTRVRLLPELSVGDPRNYNLTVPNVPLLALSTLISEQPFTSMALNMLTANLGSEPVLRLTAQQYLWGYHDTLVDMANTILPGWIDFPQFGILDRMYSEKDVWVEVESADRASQFAIRSWDGAGGLPQWGYEHLNTSTPCNRLDGAYEGILYSPGLTPDSRLRVFRKQICRVLPLRYSRTFTTDFDVDALEFKVEDNAFDPVEENNCLCRKKCLPKGLSDLSPCYYQLPLALSWPHLLDADPTLLERLEGMRPNRTLHETFFRIEPKTGVPVGVVSSTQTNLLVGELAPHMRGAGFSRMLLPLCWMHMEYEALPAEYQRRLRWALVLAPYLLLALEGVLLVGGALALLVQARNYFLRSAARSPWRYVYQTVPARATDDKAYIHENPTFV